MLCYELARRLRDAGFAQSGEGRWSIPVGGNRLSNDEGCYVPTLEELIEACGGMLLRIERHDTELGVYWMAESIARILCSGATANQAVARLWLSLIG